MRQLPATSASLLQLMHDHRQNMNYALTRQVESHQGTSSSSTRDHHLLHLPTAATHATSNKQQALTTPPRSARAGRHRMLVIGHTPIDHC